MKKIFVISLLTGLVACYGCKKPCKGIVDYTPIDSRLLNYVFKPGSYWVYLDTVDGIRDSQYVYAYIHLTHYEYINTDTLSPVNHQECPGPLYTDELQMHILSFYNNIFNDTLAIGASFGNGNYTINTLSIYEHYNLPNQTGIPAFELDVSQIGLVEYFLTVKAGIVDTSNLWYEGNPANISSGAYTFPNVNIFRIQILDNYSTRFTNPTDLYYASGYGIVKIVEHRPTGDVSHDLVNYKIIN